MMHIHYAATQCVSELYTVWFNIDMKAISMVLVTV